MLGCWVVPAIAPDKKLSRRIQPKAAERGLDEGVLRFINDRSERALPRLALEEHPACDIGFNDGNHG
jgi:hypothetical protein